MSDWVTPLSTVVLVGVTAWYAKLTRDISGTSRDAAVAAQNAADYAGKSVSAALAGIPVELQIVPAYRFHGWDEDGVPPDWWEFSFGLHLVNRGGHLYVHEVVLDLVYRAEIENVGERRAIAESLDEALAPPGVDLPHRLHGGEAVEFWSPSVLLPRRYVAGVTAYVDYSFDGEEVFRRKVAWWGGEESDFKSSDRNLMKRDPSVVSGASNWSVITPVEIREGVKWKKRDWPDLIEGWPEGFQPLPKDPPPED